MKRTLDFALGLGTPGTAGHRTVTVVRGEGQEARIIDRLVVFVPGDHDFHAVVETGRGDTAQVLEGLNVLPLRRLHVLRFDEPQVLPARVAQDQAEQVDPPPAFLGEVQRVDGIIHLSLDTGSGLEPLDPGRLEAWTQLTDTLTEDAVAAGVTAPPQFLPDPLDRDLRIAREQILNRLHVRIDQARAARPRSLQFRRHGSLLTLVLVLLQDRLDGLAGQLHLARHATHGLSAIPATNDLIANLGIHALPLLSLLAPRRARTSQGKAISAKKSSVCSATIRPCCTRC